MIGEKVRIDGYYEYEIEDVKEGGMGEVYILNRVSAGDKLFDALADNYPRVADEFSLTYRKKIARKMEGKRKLSFKRSTALAIRGVT